MELVLKVVAKVALNTVAPGYGAVVEFGAAAKNFYDGDVIGGLVNILSGVSDVSTFGLASKAKNAMIVSGKKAVIETAKETAKTAGKKATKEVGGELAKQLAKGTITSSAKEAAVESAKIAAKSAYKEATQKVGGELAKQLAKGTISSSAKQAAVESAKIAAKFAGKEATKQVGQQVGKELAMGVLNVAAEEAFFEGTKITFESIGTSAYLSAVSSGGRDVFKTISGDLGEELLTSVVQKAFSENAKKLSFEFTKEAAKTAAKEEFQKYDAKKKAKDVYFSVAKGILNCSRPKDGQ